MPGSNAVEQLSTVLIAETERHLRDFLQNCPDLELPRVFAGHPVGADTRADLAFTIGLLGRAGVTDVGGASIEEALRIVLRPIDGRATHTFFSYRVAETLAHYGPLDDHHPVVGDFTPAQRHEVEMACDSTDWIELLDGALPANYAAVLARCELARAALGLEPDVTALDQLIERTEALLSRNPKGYIDDSEDGAGGRFDIYSADIYLFTETFADRLGDTWTRGARSALELVGQTAARNGAGITWGRSTGALAVCLTIELAALALERDLTDRPARWLRLAQNACGRFGDWMTDGLVNAHQHRSTYHYRGPERRLQMTLDCLGKLAWAALQLRACDRPDAARDGDGSDDPWQPRNRLIRFDDRAAVWSYRSRDTAFAIPFVGPTRSDYLPAPVNPDLFEVPVDASLVTGAPVVWANGVAYAGGGVPTSIEQVESGLAVDWEVLPEVQTQAGQNRVLGGRRHAEFRAEGRTLHVRDELVLDSAPDSISLQLAESEHRALRVDWNSDGRATTLDGIDVSGLREYRSFWSELPRVHQIDLEPARHVRFDWSITAAFRIATSEIGHHYHRSIYDPLVEGRWVTETQMSRAHIDDPKRGAAKLRDVDFFHLHWPEWFVGIDLDAADRFIELLRAHDVKLVWTQHNLVPHSKDPGGPDLYQFFAEHADTVVHHSEWGAVRMRRRYDYGPQVAHRVIAHSHWGHLATPTGPADRRAAEQELGLEPCEIRIGVVGAPRAEKKTRRFMDAFARTRRDDLQLLVLSLEPEANAPDDPRITALPYEFIDRARYEARLAAIDVFALPFEPDGEMLTTGVVGDVVASGKPALVSEWGYLVEALGPAGITFGWDLDQMADAIDGLTASRLNEAAAACRALQPRYDNERIAAEHLLLLEDLGTVKL